MSKRIEELDFRQTPIGDLSLRRRHDLRLGCDVFEILLGEEFLMSSHFTASEVALGRSGVQACAGETLEVMVGGLGLGYTAAEVLASPRVSELLVVDYLAPVIGWHRDGILPLGRQLSDDPRCRLIEGDVFAMSAGEGFDPDRPLRRFDAVLVDIDHTPDRILDARSGGFYQPEGLRSLQRHIKPGGVFGLWSDEPADARFLDRLAGSFTDAWAEPVVFDNPYTGTSVTQTVYLARTAARS